MSRGLGELQRAILAHLRSRRGGDPLGHWDIRCANVVIADHWHDLRAVFLEMKSERELLSAAFSSATSGLLKRRLLRTATVIPIASSRRSAEGDRRRNRWNDRVIYLAEGAYLVLPTGREWKRRFVRLNDGTPG